MGYDLLCMLSYLAPDAIPLARLLRSDGEALPASLAPAAAADRSSLIRELTDGGLLHAPEDDRVTVPTDVGTAVRDALRPDERRRWSATAVAAVLAALPPSADDVTDWPTWERLEPHARAAIDHATQLEADGEAVARLLERLAAYLDSRGAEEQARELAERALSCPGVDPESALEGSIRRTFGDILHALGDLPGAQAEVERALAIHRAVLGPADTEVGYDLMFLSSVLATRGQVAAALTQAEAAVSTLRRSGADDAAVSGALKLLGWAHLQSGNPDPARENYERAIEVLEGAHGPDHPMTASARGGLGLVLEALGELVDARTLLEDALRVTEDAYGSDHQETAILHSNLATVLEAMDDLAGARHHLERALSIGERNLPEHHPGLRIRHMKVASVAGRLGDSGEALAHLRRALEIAQRAVGDDDLMVARCTSELADALAASGDREAARAMHERALELVEGHLGSDHLDVARYCEALANTLRALGDTRAARRHYERALRIREHEEGADHPHAVLARTALIGLLPELGRDLADTYLALGEREEAESAADGARDAVSAALEREARQDRDPSALAVIARAGVRHGALGLARTTLERAATGLADDGAARTAVGSAWHQVGRAFADQGKWEHALDAYRAAAPLLESPPRLQADILQDLADALRMHGRAEEAVGHYREAIELRRQIGNQRQLAETLGAQGLAQLALGDAAAALGAVNEAHDLLRRCDPDNKLMLGATLVLKGRATAVEDDGSVAVAALKEGHELLVAGEAAAETVAAVTGLLVATYRSLGRDEEADRLLDAELERDANVDALPAIAVACIELGALEPAERALARAGAVLDPEAPAGRAGPRHSLGAAWHRLGRAFGATGSDERALAAYQASEPLLADDDQYVGVVLHDIAAIRERSDELTEAVELYERAVEHKRAAGDAGNPRDLSTSLLALGRAHARVGEHVAALRALETRLEILEALPEPDLHSEGVTHHDIGDVRLAQERIGEAIACYRRAVARKRETRDATSPRSLAASLFALGRSLERGDEHREARTVYLERLEILTALEERDHQAEGVTLHDLGDVAQVLGEPEKAIELYREAVELKRRAGAAKDSPIDLAASLHALGRALEAHGDHVDALDAYEQRLEILTSLPERRPGHEAVTLHDVGDIRLSQGRDDEAIACYRQAIERVRGARDAPALQQLETSLQALARTLERRREYSAALSAYEERLETLVAQAPRDPASEIVTLRDIGDVKIAQGDLDGGTEHYSRALELARDTNDVRQAATSELSLAEALLMAGSADTGRRAAEHALAALRALPDARPAQLRQGLALAAEAMVQSGDAPSAVTLLEELVATAVEVGDADLLESASHWAMLAAALDAAERPDAAATARAELERLVPTAIERGIDPDDLANLCAVGIRCALAGALSTARMVADSALEVADNALELTGSGAAFARREIAELLLLLAGAHGDRGDLAEAAALYLRAVQTAREAGIEPSQLSLLLTVAGEATLALGHSGDAIALLEEARELAGDDDDAVGAIDKLLADAGRGI